MRLHPGRLSALALAAAAAAAVPLGCGPRAVDHVPPELLGVWKAAAGPHARNFLEIRPGELVLGVAGIPFDVLAIERIDVRTTRDGAAIYRFHYLADEGYSDALVVTRPSSASSEIRLGSRAEPWRRSATR
jgi:hypothetical protein